MTHEIGQAARSLVKRPGVAVPAIAVLAMGLGTFVAVSSVVERLLLRPIPARQLGSLVVGWETDPSEPDSLVEVSLPYFFDLRAQSRSFVEMAAFGSVNWSHEIPGAERLEQVPAAAVSASFFHTLGASPLLGRTFEPREDEPGAEPVLVLSYGLWQRRFSGDASVLGSTLPTGERIVGVMPRNFDYPQGAQLWKPVVGELESVRATMEPLAFRGLGVLYIVGRLGPGVSLDAARSELGDIAARLSLTDGFSTNGWRFALVPIVDHYLGTSTRRALEALAAAASLLLLLACANTALLLLAHTMERRNELAVRQALGASGTRLLLTASIRSLLVTSVACVAGSLMAMAALRGVAAYGPDNLPGIRDLGLDASSLVVGGLATLAVALIVTLAPAWYSLRQPVAPTLKRGAGAHTDPRGWALGRMLVGSEVAVAVVLLVGSALLVRSLDNLMQVDLGFDPDHTVSFSVDRRDAEGQPQQDPAFVEAFTQRLRALPDVAAAGAVFLRPLEHGPIGSDGWVLTEGTPLDRASVVANSVSVNWQVATPGYFRAIGTRIVTGRGFSEADSVDAPKVVVVSESVARRCWPGEDPLGKRLHTHGAAISFEDGRFFDVEWMEVIGVVEDARYRGIQRPRPAVYLSYLQAPSPPRHYVVRTHGDPLAVVDAARGAARSLDRTAIVGDVATLESLVDRALVPWRFTAVLLTGFAAVALVLTASGLLGVLHRFVTLHTREIAIRVAVGATPADVTRRVLGQGVASTLVGVAAGIAASFALAGSLGALLYGVSAHDPTSHVAASAFILALASLTCWLPARRAATTDPARVLRAE